MQSHVNAYQTHQQLAEQVNRSALLAEFNAEMAALEHKKQLAKAQKWAKRYLSGMTGHEGLAPDSWAHRAILKKHADLFEKNSERTANIWLKQNGLRLQQIADKAPFLVAHCIASPAKAKAVHKVTRGLFFPHWVYSDRRQLEKTINDIADFNANFVDCWIARYSVATWGEYARLLSGLAFTLSRGVSNKSIMPPTIAPRPKKLTEETAQKWAEKLESAILKLQCNEWLLRSATRHYEKTIEHAHIAAGNVARGRGAYVSNWTANRIKERRKRSAALMESLTLVDENGDTIKNAKGETATLAEVAQSTVANPENRRHELMTRISGNEAAAKEAGHVGLFLTLTAPSKYHATRSNGRYNPKYNGNTPRETQDYLARTWAQMRAALKRAAIPFYGVRVSEPHHDATPHWHMLVFIDPQNRAEFEAIFVDYATAEDNEELKGNYDRRAKIIEIEAGRSAAGYVAKYISKNIDGHQVDQGDSGGDYEAATAAKDSAPRATYWAALWNIRQFQFFGNPSVSVWRALRLAKNSLAQECEAAEAVRLAADSGDWLAYVNAQGGMGNGHGIVRTLYIDGSMNPYGESLSRIAGIKTAFKEIVTKTKAYAIARLGDVAKEALKGSVSDRPWTRVNNCTVEKAAKAAGIPPNLYEQLARGCRVIDQGQLITMKYGIVSFSDYAESAPNGRVFIQQTKTPKGWQPIAVSDGRMMKR